MSEINNNVETEQQLEMPNLTNLVRNLFEQVHSQTETNQRRVRFPENRTKSDEKKQESEESDSDESDNVNKQDETYKWEVLMDLLESHKLLCKAFSNILNLE